MQCFDGPAQVRTYRFGARPLAGPAGRTGPPPAATEEPTMQPFLARNKLTQRGLFKLAASWGHLMSSGRSWHETWSAKCKDVGVRTSPYQLPRSVYRTLAFAWTRL